MTEILNSATAFLQNLGLLAILPIGVVLFVAVYLFRRFVRLR